MQPQFFPQPFDQIFQHSGLSRILCVVPDLLFLDLAVDKTYNEEDEEIIWTFDNQDDIDDDGQMLYYLVSTSGSANSHFLRTAGPHFPDNPGHIKRTALETSRTERRLRPANQY